MCGLLIFALTLLTIPVEPCRTADPIALRLGYGTTILPTTFAAAGIAPIAVIDARNAWRWTEGGALAAGAEGIVRYDARFDPVVQLSELDGPTSFSPNGAYAAVATVSEDSWPPQTERDITIIPLDSRAPIRVERAERLAVGGSSAHRVGSWSPDSRWLLLRRFAYREVETDAQLALSVEGAVTTLPGQSAFAWHWLPDSTLAASTDGQLNLISPQGEPVRRIELERIPIHALFPAPSGRLALIWAEDGWHRLDLLSGSTARIEGLTTDHRLQWSPGGARAVFYAPGSALLIYDAERGELHSPPELRMPAGRHSVRSIAWSPNGSRLIVILSLDEQWWRYRAAHIVDTHTLQSVELDLSGLSAPGCLGRPAWSPDAAMFAFVVRAGRDNAVRQLRIHRSDGLPIRTLTFEQLNHAIETRLSWSPGGRWLAVGVYETTCP